MMSDWKRRAVCLCLLALLCLLLCPAAASAAAPTGTDTLFEQLIADNAQKAEQPPVELGGDILLIYPDGVTEQVRENVPLLADAATCLNRKLVFVPASEASGHLDGFPYLICYALGDEEAFLLPQLADYSGKTCILGGRFLQMALELPERAQSVSGVLRYSLNDMDWFESSVRFDHAPDVAEEDWDWQSGTVIFHGGTMPFFAGLDGYAFCPVTELSSPVLQQAVLQELSAWLWPYLDAPPSYAQYLVLDQIYPFMPAQELLERVQLCIDSNMPFVLSVMPIYRNAQFPAMQQFCQVLQYAQANGGAVILHAPILHAPVEDFDTLRTAMTTATQAYVRWGVYPLGLQVPREWTWEESMLEFMRRYRTVFVYGAERSRDLTPQTNLVLQNYHQLIMPAIELDGVGVSYLSCYSSAVYLDVRGDVRELEETIRHLRTSSVPLKSLWDMDHSVWADNFHLSCTGGSVSINDQPQSLSYHPEPYPEKFAYNRNTLQRITVSLKSQNQKLLLAATLATAAFLLMIIQARRTVVRYFRHRNKLPDRKKNLPRKKE